MNTNQRFQARSPWCANTLPYSIGLIWAVFGTPVVHGQNVLLAEPPIQTITVLASPPNALSLSSPVKTLSPDELRNKLGVSLGESLSGELGLSASGFGAAASRPIIRGMEGARVQILENGMAMSDVSTLSNDHAVANGLTQTKAIEILRGSSALKYGPNSGSGVINILNDKILTELPTSLSASIDSRLTSADHGASSGLEMSTSQGPLAIHLDASKSVANDYAIPSFRELGGPNANWPGKPNTSEKNRLPYSYSFSENAGAGLSLINPMGYTGVSYEHFTHQYGIPSLEGSQIQQQQNKLDLQHLTQHPLPGIDALVFKASSTQYQHTELSTSWVPSTQFTNQGYDARLEFVHQKMDHWDGLLGLGYSKGQLSAFDLLNPNHAAIVPPTESTTWSAFWIEEKKWADLTTDFGLRFERVQKQPNALVPYTDSLLFTPSMAGEASTPTSSFQSPVVSNKAFNTLSWSTGLLYPLSDLHSAALHYSLSQRAPASDELFSYGAHDATATFDIGKANLVPETAHNLEVNFMKTRGLTRWKTNFFYNKIENFIYGAMAGLKDPQTGYEIRQFNQADVIQKGAEAEFSMGSSSEGSVYKLFTDHVQTQFMNGSYTPLQAPVRLGLDWSYRDGDYKGGLSAIHAFKQTHLSSGEIAPTPAYTDLRASWSFHQRLPNSDLDWYILAKNLLNQDIRYSTTVQTLRLYAPQTGKSFTLGVKWYF